MPGEVGVIAHGFGAHAANETMSSPLLIASHASISRIQSVSGHWPLRLQDSPENPDTERRYRECWKRNQRVLFAYAGGRPVPDNCPGFVCDCLMCV